MTGYITKDSGKRQQFDTGMQRDTQDGKPRFDLIAPLDLPYEEQMLTRWAKLMARGAAKYSVNIPVDIGQLTTLCSCGNQTVIHTALTMLADFAEAVTKEISAEKTKHLPNANAPTGTLGVRRILIAFAKAEEIISRTMEKLSGLCGDAGQFAVCLQMPEMHSWLTKEISAQFADGTSGREDQTLITTTVTGWQEAFFARLVTKLLASSTTLLTIWGEHKSTCRIRQLTSTSDGTLALRGDRNWETARTSEEEARFRASAFRHFMQWFTGQNDEDHAAAVLFNIQGAEMVRYRLLFEKYEEDE